jgi:hypothetical protein
MVLHRQISKCYTLHQKNKGQKPYDHLKRYRKVLAAFLYDENLCAEGKNLNLIKAIL